MKKIIKDSFVNNYLMFFIAVLYLNSNNKFVYLNLFIYRVYINLKYKI